MCIFFISNLLFFSHQQISLSTKILQQISLSTKILQPKINKKKMSKSDGKPQPPPPRPPPKPEEPPNIPLLT
jgi:hypothetical protein